MPDTAPLGIPAVEVASRSDPGRDPTKQINEDAAGFQETAFGHLCVVCDGMGGHEGGREASNVALQTIFDVFERAREHVLPHPDASPGARGRELLEEAIVLANRRVFELKAAQAVGRPGATVVAILLHAGGTEVAHVGDSRCYRVHHGQITQVTRDHSMVQELVDAKVLTPEQAASHPDANKITRALGMGAEVEVDVRSHPLAHFAGDVFVLCSDGLSDLVGPPDIAKLSATLPAAQAAQELVDLANARGGHDNISVVVLRAHETALTHREAVSVTEAMPAPTVIDPSSVQAAATGSGRLPVVGGNPTAGPSYHASDPPPVQVRRAGRVPAAVVLAIVLGIVGLAVGGIALWLVLPHHKNAPSGAFVMPSSTATSVCSIPMPEAPPPDAAATETPEPLPKLVPSPQRRGRGRRAE